MSEKKPRKSISTEQIVYLAILVALQVILARFISINTMGFRIGFSFVPVMVAAYLYGPVSAGIVSALADIIGALAFPTGTYHPGFTVMAFCSGAVFGLLLKLNGPNDLKYWLKVVLAVLINCLIIGMLIDSIWVAQLYGSKTYTGWVIYRLTTQYAVMIPVEIIFAPIVKYITKLVKKAVRT